MSNNNESNIILPTESEVTNKIKETPISIHFITSINNILSKFLHLKTLPAKSATFTDKSLPLILTTLVSAKKPSVEQTEITKRFIENYVKLISSINFNQLMLQCIQKVLSQSTEHNRKVETKFPEDEDFFKELLDSKEPNKFFTSDFGKLPEFQQYLVFDIFSTGLIKNIYTAAKEDKLQSQSVKAIISVIPTIAHFLDDKAEYHFFHKIIEAIGPLLAKTPDQNIDGVLTFMKDSISAVPDLGKIITETLCQLVAKMTNLQSKTKILQYLLDLPIESSPEELKKTIIELLVHPQGNNPKYIKSLIQYLPKLTNYTQFNQDDILKLLSKGFMQNEVYSNLAITLLPSIKGSVERISNFCIGSDHFSAPLLVTLIGRVDSSANLSKSLFQRLVRDQKKLTAHDMLGIISNKNLKKRVKCALEDLSDTELIEKVSYFYLNTPYLDDIQHFLTSLAQASMRNPELVHNLDIFSSILSSIDCSTLILNLLNAIVDGLLSQQETIPTGFTLILCHWIEKAETLPEKKLLDALARLNFSQIPQSIVLLIEVIIRKVSDTPEVDKLVIKLAQDTVQKKLAKWAMKLIFDTLHHKKQAVIDITNILINHLSNEEKFDNAAQMIYEGVKYEADFFKSESPSNITIILGIKDKKQPLTVTLHPLHSTRHIYHEVSTYTNIPIENLEIQIEENDDFVTLLYQNPLAHINLLKGKKINIIASENQTPAQRFAVKPVFIKYLRDKCMTPIFEALDDATPSKSLLFQIATLLFPFNVDTEAVTPMQKIIMGYGCNPVDFIGASKIFPYAILLCQLKFLPKDDAQELAQYIVDESFDIVSTGIIAKAFPPLSNNLQFSTELVRKGLIETRVEPLREMLCAMVNKNTSKEPFVQCISDAMKIQNRPYTFQFFEAMKKLHLPPTFYEQFFKDLQQYEDSHYIDPDETFIQLLKLIPVTQDTISLVIKRLFDMPTVANPIAPFVMTKEAREAAFDFIQTDEAAQLILAQLDKLPQVPQTNRKISDDLTYRGRAGLYNMQATCYINSILQSINSLPNFSANLLSLPDESLTPFVFQLRDLIARLRYTVDDAISVCQFAETLINFNQSFQEDAAEFFNKSIVDRLTTDLGQTNAITSEIQGEFENRFVSKEDGTIYSSTKFPFYHIILPIKDLDNIDQAFSQYFKGYEVDYKIENDQRVKAMNVPVITRWPNYLVVQLERYEYSELYERIKLIHEFSFPIALDPNRISAGSGSAHCDSSYALSAVIVHEGEVDSGHYFSIVQAEDGEWYLCNDSNIEYFDVTKMKSWAFGVGENYSAVREKVWTGYMLFYKRIDLAPSKIKLSPSLEEKIDKENRMKWPSVVLYSQQFLDYAMKRVKSSQYSAQAIEIAFISLFRIAAVKEEVLDKWCDFFNKSILTSKERCKMFFKLVERHLTHTLGNIISISDTTEILLEKLFSKAMNQLCDSTEPMVLLLHCLENNSSRRACQFMLNLLIDCCNYPFNWVAEDKALLAIVSYLSNSNLAQSFKSLSGKQHPVVLNKLMDPVQTVLSTRGITPAIYAIFSIDGINRIANSAKKSDAFLDILQKIARIRPSMYNDQKFATQSTKQVLQQISIPESKQEMFVQAPHVDVSPLWESLSNLIFSGDVNGRRAACTFIKSKIGDITEEARDFFDGGFLNKEFQKPVFNSESSIAHFAIGLIPKCIDILGEDQSRTIEYLDLLIHLSKLAPCALSSALAPLAKALMELDNEKVALMIITTIVNVTAFDHRFLDNLDQSVVEFILSSSLVGRIPALFLIETRERGITSHLYTQNINHFLSSESSDICELLSTYVCEYGAPDFEVPTQCSGFEQLILATTLWDKCVNLRKDLGVYMINNVRGIKSCPPLVRTKIVKKALTMAAESSPEEMELFNKEVEGLPWFSK